LLIVNKKFTFFNIKTLDTTGKMYYIIGEEFSTLAYQVLNLIKTKGVNEMDESSLSKRKQQILRAIVDAHISHGEPVGSKYLSQNVGISASSATIRNEMAELEEMGYLIQPHTSAGRVPSVLGYRYYVDALVRQYAETKSEINEINERLRYKLTEMDQILSEASHLASSFTDYTGIAFKTGTGKARIHRFDAVYISNKSFHLVMTFSGNSVKSKTIMLGFTITRDDVQRFIETANIYLANLTSDEITMPTIMKLEAIMGASAAMVHPAIKAIYEAMNELDTADIKVEGVNKLLKFPEYSDVSKLRDLLGVLEEKDKLLDVLSAKDMNEDGINVYIGNEGDDVMGGTTLIFKNVNVGGSRVAVGVIGPKRMDYEKVIAMINRLTYGMDKMFDQDGARLISPSKEED
jgi:heat-inducible transcriptional repressor